MATGKPAAYCDRWRLRTASLITSAREDRAPEALLEVSLTVHDKASRSTGAAADAVAQSFTSDSFEEATEFGVPRAIRPPSEVLKLGYSFPDWDIALRTSWKFLRQATAEQIKAQVTRVLESDNKLTMGTILQRLFDPTQRVND